MTIKIIISLVVLAVGLAVLIGSITSRGSLARDFPRPDTAVARSPRLWAMAVGAILVLGGAAMLLLTITTAP